MPTRFHVARTTAADISPAFDAEWENTASALRLGMTVAGFNEAVSALGINDSTATANRDTLHFQFVSDGLAPGPISGTLKGQMQAFENVASTDIRLQMIVRVVSNDGSTFRGTLYGPDTAALSSEFNTTRRNVKAPRGGAAALSLVTAQLNDRIVIEIGWRKHAAASATASLYAGGLTADSDLPEDETTTSTSGVKPWFEFSDDLYTSRLRGARAYILD